MIRVNKTIKKGFFMKMKYIEYILVFTLAFILFYKILGGSGTMESGYHFLDDHELIRIEYSIDENQQSVVSVMQGCINNDLKSRFRPMYWVERIACTAIFGSDLLYWNIYTAIKGILTFYLLYYTAKYLKFNWHISLVFSGIIIFGDQFVPWFRSANQENTGLLFCAFVMWIITRQYHAKKFSSILYNGTFCIGVIICGLIKESFVILMPAFIALKFWLEYCYLYDTVDRKGMWRKCLRGNIVTYGITFLAFLINLYILLFYVGVDKVSYAGFHEGTSLYQYYYGVRDSLLVFLKWYNWMGIMLIITTIVCYQVIEKKYWKNYLGFGIIGAYIMGTQLLAHAKSLMWERYIIPFIIGYALVFVLLGYRIFSKDKFRRKVYEGLLVVLLIMEIQKSYDLAVEYAWNGKLIQEYLQCVLENTNESSVIIGAFSDAELNLATSSWLEVRERTKEYTYQWQEEVLYDSVQMAAVNQDTPTWEMADAALCYTGQIDKIVELMEITEVEGYREYQFGGYAVVIRQ